MYKNSSERKMAMRFIQVALVIVAILCISCGNVQPRDFHRTYHVLRDVAELRHHQMHNNGEPHTHSDTCGPYHSH